MTSRRDREEEERDRERRLQLKLAGDVRRPLKASHKPLSSLLPTGTAAPVLSNDIVKALVGKKGSDAVVDVSGSQLDNDAWLSGALDQIVELDLSQNNLSRLSSVKHLSKLRVLLADHNALVEVALSGLVRLETLSLAHNRLDTMPDCSDLTRLVCLDLSYNRLTRGFAHLESLKSLRTLDVSYCALDMAEARDLELVLLAHLRTLPKLTALNLKGNACLNLVPQCAAFVLSRLPHLRVLNLESVTKEQLRHAEAEALRGAWGALDATRAAGTLAAAHPSPQRRTPSGATRHQPQGITLKAAREGRHSGGASKEAITSLNLEELLAEPLLRDMTAPASTTGASGSVSHAAPPTLSADAIDLDALLGPVVLPTPSPNAAEEDDLRALLSPTTAIMLAKAEERAQQKRREQRERELREEATETGTATRTRHDAELSDDELEAVLAEMAAENASAVEAPRSELETKLLTVLGSPSAMALFEAFLAKEHSLENLHFYTRVQRFKRDASDLSAEALATEARDVVATFLDDDAEELVNLEARVRGPVVSAVHNAAAAGAVTAAVFDHAANAALKLMAFDSFSRFLNTPEGARCWQLAQTPPPEPAPAAVPVAAPRAIPARSLRPSASSPAPAPSTSPSTSPSPTSVVAPRATTPSPPRTPVSAPSPSLLAAAAPAPGLATMVSPVSVVTTALLPGQLAPTQLSDERVLESDAWGTLSSALLTTPTSVQRVLVRTVPASAALLALLPRLTALPSSPLLARVYGGALVGVDLRIVYELHDSTPLRSLLTPSARRLSAREILAVVRDTASALHTLHAHGLSHGALTPRTVLLTPQGRACLTDYAHAALFEGAVRRAALDVPYAAPEGSREAAADVYALGMLLHALLEGVESEDAARILAALRADPSAQSVLLRLVSACVAPVGQRATLTQVLRILAQRDDILLAPGYEQPKGRALPPRAPLPVRQVTSLLSPRDPNDEIKVRAILDKVAELLQSPVPALQVKALHTLRAMLDQGDPTRLRHVAEHGTLLRALSTVLAQAGQVGKYDVVEQALLLSTELAQQAVIAQHWAHHGVLTTLSALLTRVEDAPLLLLIGRTLATLVDAYRENASALRGNASLASLAALLQSPRPSVVSAACLVLAPLCSEGAVQDALLGFGAWQPLTDALASQSVDLRVHALAVLVHFHAHALVASAWPALRVPASLLALAASPQLSWRLPALTALRALPANFWSDASQLTTLLRAAVAALAPANVPVTLAAAQLLFHLTAGHAGALAELRVLLPLTRVLETLAATAASATSLAHTLLLLADRLAHDDPAPTALSVAALDTLARMLSSPALPVRLACLALLARALTPARALYVAESRLCSALASTLLEEQDAAALQLTCAVVAQLAQAPSLLEELIASGVVLELVDVLESDAAADRVLLALLGTLLMLVRTAQARVSQALVEADAVKALLRTLSRAQLERERVRVLLTALQCLSHLVTHDMYAAYACVPLRAELAALCALLAEPHSDVLQEVLTLLTHLASVPALVPLLKAGDPGLVRIRALSVAPPPMPQAVKEKARALAALLQ